MTLAITKAPNGWSTYGSSGAPWHMMFELAVALSAHAGWDIIDSYAPSATPDRVYGDPISGGTWGGLGQNAGQGNAWFVAEQKNPTGGRPAMQIKFQCANSGSFDDPSGNDYGNEGQNRFVAVRLAPFGGWDSDPSTPDFANPSKVTQNNFVGVDDGADNGNHYYHIDDDHIMHLMYDTTDNNWHAIMFYVGEYTPMFAGQDTADHPAYMYYGSSADVQIAPRYTGISTTTREFIHEKSAYAGPIVACPDENGDMQEWYVYCPPMNNGFIVGPMTPNEFDPVVGVDLIEVIFAGRAKTGSPDSRMIGSLKHVWRGWGLGNGGFIGFKQYLTLGSNAACAIVDWDGVTNL